jgi:hypothetical protein
MRHVVLSGAIATGPRGMVHPTAAAGLIPPAGGTLGVAPRRLCTALSAVNLAAIAVAADENLSLAARTQKQSGSRRRCGQQRTWTRSAMIGILPRHACSARCGARRRSETWQLRSAPCRPRQSGRFLPRTAQAAQAAILRAPASLWICGQHKSVAHKPTGPTAAADNLNDLEISSVRTTPGFPSDTDLNATRHRRYYALRHIYAGSDSRSQPSVCADFRRAQNAPAKVLHEGVCVGPVALIAVARRRH